MPTGLRGLRRSRLSLCARCSARCRELRFLALSLGFPTASAGLASAPSTQVPRIGLLFCAASTSGFALAFCALCRSLPPQPFSARARIFSSRAECPKNFSRGRLSIFTKCRLPPISARRRRFFSPRRSARAPCGNSCGGGDFQGAKKCGLQRQTALGSGIAALSFGV